MMHLSCSAGIRFPAGACDWSSPSQSVAWIVNGLAVHDREGRGKVGKLINVGGQRIAGISDKVGELAWLDAAEPVRFAVECGRSDGVEAERRGHVNGVLWPLDAG